MDEDVGMHVEEKVHARLQTRKLALEPHVEKSRNLPHSHDIPSSAAGRCKPEADGAC
jgi:hypothetical protein